MDREEMVKIKTMITHTNDFDGDSHADDQPRKPNFNPFQQLHLQAKQPQPMLQPKAIKNLGGPNILHSSLMNTPMATLQQQLDELHSQKHVKGSKQKKQIIFSSKQEMIRYIENFRINYKTELCRNWKNTKSCEFGSECAYAHGYDELQQKPPALHKNYKTKMCKNWHEHTPNECSYGEKCQFIHDEPEFVEIRDEEPKSPSTLQQGLTKVQMNQFMMNQLPTVNPLQSLSAFNKCYFSSHPNKKTVEKAVYSQCYQNQVKDYAMMNLTKFVNNNDAQKEEAAAETPLTEESKKKFMFTMFKPLELDQYWHRYD